MPEELSCQYYQDYEGGIILPDGEHSIDLCTMTNDDNIDETDGEITNQFTNNFTYRIQFRNYQ